MTTLFAALIFIFACATPSGAAEFNLGRVNAAAIVRATLPPAPGPGIPSRASSRREDKYFNAYVLKAIDQLYSKYGLLGYGVNADFTHDLPYHTSEVIRALAAPRTMCVASQLEIILTAYEIYARETGDYSVYAYLPKRSYAGLSAADLKGHIWVNPRFKSYGTTDALINFGMGERRSFKELEPGDFLNLNRNNGTGHAVTFVGYIDGSGGVLPGYGPEVVGFKYFSAQGGAAPGKGGLDYRYAVFSQFGCPKMPYKRDCGIIYSADQKMLNTGRMLAPAYWTGTRPALSGKAFGETALDADFFGGITTDD